MLYWRNGLLASTVADKPRNSGYCPSRTIADIIRSCDRSEVTQRHGNMTLSVSGDCRSPKTVCFFGVKTEKLAGVYDVFRQKGGFMPTLYLDVRCRRCPECLRRRSREWTARARCEIQEAARTWMATFTLSPQSRYRLELEAAARLRLRSVSWADLCPREKLEELRKQFGAEVTKFIKRLRKKTGAPLRYYLVFESHKSGQPHAHALIHEGSVDLPIRHAELSRQWQLGHTLFKLADIRSAGYVAKYLTKEALLRVRASLKYGRRQALSERKERSELWGNTPPKGQKRSFDDPLPLVVSMPRRGLSDLTGDGALDVQVYKTGLGQTSSLKKVHATAYQIRKVSGGAWLQVLRNCTEEPCNGTFGKNRAYNHSLGSSLRSLSSHELAPFHGAILSAFSYSYTGTSSTDFVRCGEGRILQTSSVGLQQVWIQEFLSNVPFGYWKRFPHIFTKFWTNYSYAKSGA